MANIRFEGVQRVFRQNGREVVALEGIDLLVQDREFVAIVGPSGCGKTTILNMVAGFMPVTGGEIHDAAVTERAAVDSVEGAQGGVRVQRAKVDGPFGGVG